MTSSKGAIKTILDSKITIKKITDANLWIKKYFIEFSNDLIPSDDIIGKNLNIFISREIHREILDILLNAKKILILKKTLNKINGLKIIK